MPVSGTSTVCVPLSPTEPRGAPLKGRSFNRAITPSRSERNQPAAKPRNSQPLHFHHLPGLSGPHTGYTPHWIRDYNLSSMGKKRWVLLIIVPACLFVSVFGIKGVIDRRAEQKRQIEYQSVLKEYSGALKPGMTRREVESFLRLKGHSFQQMCCVGVRRNAWADLVRIGKDQAPWYCSQSNVYVALEFETTEPHGINPDARDSDRLEDVALFPWLEGCL